LQSEKELPIVFKIKIFILIKLMPWSR
jgi:hypothetical protein